MQLEAFLAARPYLYHLTAASNLNRIQSLRTIFSAAALMEQSENLELLRTRRLNHVEISVAGEPVFLRDQAPLHLGNMTLPAGYSFADFIESLNRRVFFWPGTSSGPIAHGVRHFERYQDEEPVIIRISSSSLIANGAAPQFCAYNSGSPRCFNGAGSPRGPNTFVQAASFTRIPSQVVEVTFEESIDLPPIVEVGPSPSGPWHKL